MSDSIPGTHYEKGDNDMKISIGSKLWMGFLSVLLVLMVVGGISYQNTLKLIDSAQWLTHSHQVLGKLAELLSTLKDAETGQRGYLITGEERYLAPYRTAVGKVDKQIQELKQLTQDNQSQQQRLEAIGPLIADKLNELKETIDLRRNKGLEAANTVVLSDLGKKLMDDLRIALREIADQEKEYLKHREAEARASADFTTHSTLLATLSASGLVILLGLLLTRHISRPLKDMTEIADRIASGDVSTPIAANQRTDEIGTLLRAFSLMLGSLREMASIATQIAAGDLRVQVKPQSAQDTLGNAFAVMVNNLRELTREMLENVNVLTSAASQILATTTQAASSSAETATAVSETTATVEEVKQTVRMASQKAKNVSENAQQMAQAGQSGQRALEQMIDGMGHIRAQTAATADSIARLSEQSQAIGEIIATVNDLAEQSNLLAVNAAIEAAKVGEQGKGFGVVAQEIKSLALQSKQATSQVRAILSDIQKATTAAVMATDLNGKAVEAGVQQSAAAGAAIQLLADNISAAAQAALQIAASSQQQMVGMDQVAMAMDNIKQASSQNMAGTRQAETAAHSLHELGVKLKQMVEQYKL
ncbi:MAG: CHASE3 domain-containing protein [Methylomonas sp.]|uniref:methyl-accepting chemotaxis protein n=1 Tax=Methylomonas sp. TaxID=418 RepID=UPI0025FC4E50|nr:CHASE3 domain-containing protein [Methylomonas sp.]MCK9607486.1 CHASE3 domain-containing protein [Methylomonas sp.]